jgi:hypothetical protein
MLLHGEGAAIAASLITGVKYSTEVMPFTSWRDTFDSGLSHMFSEDASRVASFQDRFSDISHQYDGIQDDISNSQDYQYLRDQVRGLGTQRRFRYERYFAGSTSRETASKVLGAYRSDGSYRNWTDSELDELRQGHRVLAESDEILGKRVVYEGDHGRAISRAPIDDMGKIYDPDNVRIYSPKGHLEHAHKGNWQNTSDEPYTDVTDRAKDIRTEERNQFDRSQNTDEIIGISIGLAAGSISAILKYRELSKHPLPWNRRKTIAVTGAFLSGAATGVVPYLLIQNIHNPVRHFLEGGVSDLFFGGEVLVQDAFLDNLADASGDFVLIMSAIAVRTLIQGGLQANRLGIRGSAANVRDTLVRTSIEQGAFFALDLILDCITPIPDPVLGPVITGLRITWSVGKITLSIKHRKRLTAKRLDALHDAAYAIVAG